MAIPQNLLNVLLNLPSGTKVTITCEWCIKHGIPATKNDVKSWGRDVSKNFSKYGLIENNSINPSCGKFSCKSSNNLKHYIKV